MVPPRNVCVSLTPPSSPPYVSHYLRGHFFTPPLILLLFFYLAVLASCGGVMIS